MKFNNNSSDDIKSYKKISGYLYEVIIIICPYCQNMTEYTEDWNSICKVCGRMIESEMEDSYEES